MPIKENPLSISLLDSFHTQGAGYDVLRYVSLPDLLGTEAHTLLYFMGRNLARKMNVQTLDDIFNIYNKLGWGRLELIKEKKKHLTFQLMSDAIVQRIKAPIDTEFRLEAGFLAEAIEIISERGCECQEDINQNLFLVQFQVIYT
ncbi:DUF2507 domain-containing protein [Virgibacillus sp. W0430]|uniref:DUF2507 domain-containing protein n=1 Tax=Virgibacillus sp. W0430 TaxID=3391580 RepID=UPI003F485C6F